MSQLRAFRYAAPPAEPTSEPAPRWPGKRTRTQSLVGPVGVEHERAQLRELLVALRRDRSR